VERNPWALIIGNRKLEALEVPEISRFGRKFSNFWVGYETGAIVADSQCGMRAYPLFFVQGFSFWTKGFEFEIEILTRFLWARVEVKEISIEVLYEPPEKRVSHFRKFSDNARISCLNTILVIVALFRSGLKPMPAALAMGLGIFIGCSPLYGLHTVMAIVLALLFRLNAVLLVIGTHISIAPLAPLIVAGSILIGAKTRLTLLPSVSHFWDWPLGSVILGGGLGFLFGVVTYGIVFLSSGNRRTASAWNGRMRGGDRQSISQSCL